jgi:hypothetical protein
MIMRDGQRLEKLSSTASLGLWADDVLFALDRVTSSSALLDVDATLLSDAAGMLEAALQWAEYPLAAPKSAGSLAAASTALMLVAAFALRQPEGDGQKILRAMASILREVGQSSVTQADPERVRPAMEFFGKLGEHQLIASNSILASRKSSRAWTAAPWLSS